MNTISYKDFFQYIKENKIWSGFKKFSGGMDMIQPKDSFDVSKTKSYTIDENGNIIKNIMGVIWYTNLEISKRYEIFETIAEFNSEFYPKYDNYNAINVNKVAEIPLDYDGIMGVPITFLEKYNPKQFEILGIDRYISDNPNYGKRFSINGKEIYARILIKNKNPRKAKK